MVALTAVKASNALIRSSLPPSPTALFVGSTAGIGLAIKRAFAANFKSPTIYFVSRSKSNGDKYAEELKKINGEGRYEYILGDFTLLHEAERVSQTVLEKVRDTGLDYVCMSPGYLDFSGRHDTNEGLDALLTLRYHARFLLLHRLFTSLPPSKAPKHVLTVLAATMEGKVLENDLTLKDPNNYGFARCADHAATFNSLTVEKFAEEYKDTTFVHMYPGVVKTRILGEAIKNPLLKWLVEWLVIPLMSPIMLNVEDVGERGLFALTSERYQSRSAKEGEGKGGKGAGVKLVEGVKVAEKGKGAYLIGKDGEEGEGKVMKGYRESGLRERLWENTLGVFDDVLKKSV